MKTDKQITISQYRLSRRDFVAAACLTFVGRVPVASAEGAASTRWAMISDTHIPAVDNSATPPRGHYYFDPIGNLNKVAAAIATDLPAAAVITGDLARLTGEPGDYANLAKCLAGVPKKCPVFQALGNHDRRGNFRDRFMELPGVLPPVEDRHVTVIDVQPVRFILLDSLKTGETGGELGPVQLAWLKSVLAAHGDTPTLLFLHHNLTPEGGIADVTQFYDIIRPARCVKAVFFGHSHVGGYALVDDIHLVNLPASGYSFNEKVPVGWVDATLTRTAGRFKLNTTGGPAPEEAVKELTWR